MDLVLDDWGGFNVVGCLDMQNTFEFLGDLSYARLFLGTRVI
jgi:hypothetical protein